jgi:hypothetical protein
MKKVLLTLLTISIILILSTCYFTGNSSVSVSPVIKAIGLPTNISSVKMTVSGPGMNTMEIVYDGLPSSIDLTVPSGSDRKFVMEVYGTIPLSAATSYQGVATIDLDSGANTITLEMYAYESKLLTANPYWAVLPSEARIIQIEDMNGTGWKEINNTDLSWVGSFRPWDVEIDGNGTIIVANNDNTLSNIILFRIVNMDATSFVPLAVGDGNGGSVAVTVDRQNKMIYYATTNQLYRCDYSGSSLKNNFDMTGIGTIRGMTIDDDGILYIAHGTQIRKYNPNSGDGVILKTYSAGLLGPHDITINSSNVFVSDTDPTLTNHKIVKLDMELNFIAELINSGSFPMWGPRKFIGKRKQKIYFTDETDGTNNDKLVALDEIAGDGWETYGSYGFTTGLFAFAYGC